MTAPGLDPELLELLVLAVAYQCRLALHAYGALIGAAGASDAASRAAPA